MLKLIIDKVNNYEYCLKDKNNKVYNINIEFYGLENNPKVNDFIYINENLINKINNQVVSFGPIDEIYGKNIESSDDEDVIIVITEGKRKYLKRFYG